MRLKRKHPWNPGYALTPSLLAETGPVPRVSPMTPRGTYDDPAIPRAWNPGYALPAHVRAERPGQGVRVTRMSPRGTGGRPAPSEFASSGLEGLGAGPPLRAPQRVTVRDHSKLARGQAAAGKIKLGSASDPIASFGVNGASAVLAQVKVLPKADRIPALRAILDSLDPTMWKTVDEKLAKNKAKGVPPQKGIYKAVAAALANHFAKQVVLVGKTGAIPRQGVIGAGHYGEESHAHQALEGYLELGWSITGALKSVGSGLKAGVNAVGSGLKTAAVAVKDATKATGKAVAGAAKATYNAAKKGLNALGDLACNAANSGVLSLAAQGAGMAAGGPGGAAAGGQGADLVKGLCASGQGQQFIAPQAPAPAASTGMSTTTMLIIGGAGLAAVLLLTRK